MPFWGSGLALSQSSVQGKGRWGGARLDTRIPGQVPFLEKGMWVQEHNKTPPSYLLVRDLCAIASLLDGDADSARHSAAHCGSGHRAQNRQSSLLL